jgi:hypothetical protein
MANHFGADFAATDAARVLRLPGFANRKLAFEFVVQEDYNGKNLTVKQSVWRKHTTNPKNCECRQARSRDSTA